MLREPRRLEQRSLEQLLWEAVSSRLDGQVVVRDRDGLQHSVWLQRGYVVNVQVAGRFDPLLDALRRAGALDEDAYRACVQSLARTPARSGALAMQLGHVSRGAVRDALKEQSRARMAALLDVAARRGFDAWFEAGPVPPGLMSVRMPFGALLRHQAPHHQHSPRARPRERDRREARRQLRELAKRLHPDRNGHLDPAARRRLERALAQATAAYHGLASAGK